MDTLWCSLCARFANARAHYCGHFFILFKSKTVSEPLIGRGLAAVVVAAAPITHQTVALIVVWSANIDYQASLIESSLSEILWPLSVTVFCLLCHPADRRLFSLISCRQKCVSQRITFFETSGGGVGQRDQCLSLSLFPSFFLWSLSEPFLSFC